MTAEIPTWGDVYRTPGSLGDMLRWSVTHAAMLEDLARHDSVLEVGTGTGMLSSVLSRVCRTVVSVDDDPVVLETARTTTATVGGEAVELVRGDAFALPFATDSFAACYSQGLLEHFGDEEIVGMVDEQLRVASSVHISVPSLFYPHFGRRGPGLIGNERLMTLGRWMRVLGRFAVEGRYYADPKVASFAGRTLPWPLQIHLVVRRA